MPCDELEERYSQFLKAGRTTTMSLQATEPFARAVKEKTGWKRVQVYMVSINQLTAVAPNGTRRTFKIDGELHDMALLHVPPHPPDAPWTMAELRLHYRPDAPKDLMDKPVPDLRWRWKQVPIIDIGVDGEHVTTYAFEKEWYAAEEAPEPAAPKKAKKEKSRTVVRTVLIEPAAVQKSVVRRETILSEEEK